MEIYWKPCRIPVISAASTGEDRQKRGSGVSVVEILGTLNKGYVSAAGRFQDWTEGGCVGGVPDPFGVEVWAYLRRVPNFKGGGATSAPS